MNRGTLRTHAARFCEDPDQTKFSDQYNDSLDRAQEQFALDSQALWKDTTFTSADGDAQYDLPSDFMYEKWVEFDGKPLFPITRERLKSLYPTDDWTAHEGTPKNYIIDPEEAVKELRLYPKPQAADANKTISLRYYPLPAAMASDATIPLNSSALMAQFHLGIAAFGAWLLLTGEVQSPEVILKRRELLTIYSDAVTKAVDTFKNTASAPMVIRPNRVWG